MKKKVLVSWKARDFEDKKKNIDWYWIVFIIFFSLAGFLYYFFQELISAILILSILLVIIIAKNKKSIVREYIINNEGFVINNKKIILFNNIEGYTIDKKFYKILINTKKKYSPLVLIPFEKNQNMSKVDELLKKKIKKDESLKIPFLVVFLLKNLI